jgi:hypothetical protein
MRRCRRQVVLWITRLAWAISTIISRRCSHMPRATSRRSAGDMAGKAWRRLSRTTVRRIRTRLARNAEMLRAHRSQVARGSDWITQIKTRTATYAARSARRASDERGLGAGKASDP